MKTVVGGALAPFRNDEGRRSTEPARELFPGTPEGVEAAADFAAEQARAWNVGYVARKAALLARIQGGWLLAHQHRSSANIELLTYLEPDMGLVRNLGVMVLDAGSSLAPPIADQADQLQVDLAEIAWYWAAGISGRYRTLTAMLTVRAPWRVRIEWDVEKVGPNHPPVSFIDCLDAQHARAEAANALARSTPRAPAAGPTAVFLQGPHDQDEHWKIYNPRGTQEHAQ
jgi:hypothetical protein